MSASNINDADGPRQVVCETSDNEKIPVDFDSLYLSNTFKKMCDDLGLDKDGTFPGVFPVKTVTSRTFNKVINWCKGHKGEPEPVVKKDPLTHECKWFRFTKHEKRFFKLPKPVLLELIMAANYLDIPRLYHYACQSVAARIKGKRPREMGDLLRQNCDLDEAHIRKALDDNPWLEGAGAFPGACVENAVFIPNEVLVTIFEKLPREDLERLQLVSAQFDAVIASSNELSAHQGPLRVVTKIAFGAYLYGSRFRQRSDMWLHDGTRVTCTDCENLAKRLKFAIVQELRWDASTRLDDSDIQRYAFIQSFSSLLPVKSAWENATVNASTQCFPSKAAFEFVFTQLLFCKEVILAEISSVSWSRAYMRLPGIAACDKLSINRLDPYGEGIQPFDVIEWLDHEVPPGKKCEKKHMSICEEDIIGGISGLLAWLKTTFSASSRPKPYVVHILWCYRQDNLDEVLANEKTHERLSIRTEPTGIFGERA